MVAHGAHLLATCFMTGVICSCNCPLPLLNAVPNNAFSFYHSQHVQRTDGSSSDPCCWKSFWPCIILNEHDSNAQWLSLTGLILLLGIWASTFISQVPAHNRLARGFSSDAWRKLVLGNWIRTVGWTLRLPIVAWMTYQAFQSTHY